MTPEDFERDFLPMIPAGVRALYIANDEETRAKMRPSLVAALAKGEELERLADSLRAMIDPASRGAGEA